jgi:hypothetical protein
LDQGCSCEEVADVIQVSSRMKFGKIPGTPEVEVSAFEMVT